MAKVLSMLENMGLFHTGNQVSEPVEETVPEPVAAAEVTGISPGTPPKPRPVVSLPEVSISIDDSVDEAPEEYPFDQVYASAGVADPEHGFTVFKLIEMMEADELRDLDSATRAKVIAGMLRRLPSGEVAIDDIVRDAALRDRALDAFETFLADKAAASVLQLDEKSRELQEEIDELTRRNTELIEANQAAIEAERQRLESWRKRKQREESRLYSAVAPFVEANPVTRSSRDDTPPTADDEDELGRRR
jgi:hypothetical protein